MQLLFLYRQVNCSLFFEQFHLLSAGNDTCLNTSCGRDANQRYMLHRYATTGMTTIIYTDEKMDESKGVRYCTQTELEKLHNIPLGYTRNLNKAQAGILIGDGWTVGIVEHIFSFMRSV